MSPNIPAVGGRQASSSKKGCFLVYNGELGQFVLSQLPIADPNVNLHGLSSEVKRQLGLDLHYLPADTDTLYDNVAGLIDAMEYRSPGWEAEIQFLEQFA